MSLFIIFLLGLGVLYVGRHAVSRLSVIEIIVIAAALGMTLLVILHLVLFNVIPT